MKNNKLTVIGSGIKQYFVYADIGQKALNDLIIYVTPKWFDLLQWLIVLGFLNFIAINKNNKTINFIYNFSFLLLLLYFINIIDRSPIHKISKLISFILSLSTTVFIYFFLGNFVKSLENVITILH